MAEYYPDPFGPEALAAAVEAIENDSYSEGDNELDLWLAQVTSPEYALVISEAAERLSRAGYEAHEPPIMEALQSLDGHENAVVLATLEGILIEAYTTYLAANGIFITDAIEWQGSDILTLSNIGFALRNVADFYDPIGGLEILNSYERDEESVLTILSLTVDTSTEDMFRVVDKVDEDLVTLIANIFNDIINDQENAVGPMDDEIVANREKVRNRLIKFNTVFNPTFVKRYLAKDCKVGMVVGEQLAETAPFFFKILEEADINNFAMELAGIICLSSTPAIAIPTTLNSIIDELDIDINQATIAKRWLTENNNFLLTLDEVS